MKITSHKFFYEIFNKKSYKCQGLVVPDTILVSPTGVLTGWYFLSKKPLPKDVATNYCEEDQRCGVVLKKNHSKLIEEGAFQALYNGSLIAQFGFAAF